ncbi:hypothetical protein, partial [Salmonella enterica]|uniref:hypothetical protein n=1 Tax=Salmonella enterica TaxID=28901 RepID=UPI001C71F18E
HYSNQEVVIQRSLPDKTERIIPEQQILCKQGEVKVKNSVSFPIYIYAIFAVQSDYIFIGNSAGKGLNHVALK